MKDFNMLCSHLSTAGMVKTSQLAPGFLRAEDEEGQFSCQCQVQDCLFPALQSPE